MKGSKKGYCHKHHAQAVKHRHIISVTYNTLKQNAKRRGVSFSLTLIEFRIWVEDNGYINGKGKSAKSLSIDRIRPDQGYEIGNIQILTLSENPKKMHRDNNPDEDVPF